MANNFASDSVEGCLAWYKFEDNLNDSSGNEEHLTAHTAEAYTTTNCPGDTDDGTKALDIQQAIGTTVYIADADQPANWPGNNGDIDFGIEFWMYPKDVTNIYICGKWHASDNTGVVVTIGASGLLTVWFGDGGDSTKVEFSTACTANRWYHAGISYDASASEVSMRVWDDTAGDFLDTSDNTNVLTHSNNIATSSRSFYIGYTAGGNTNYIFNGYFDDFAVFDRVLGNDEIDRARQGRFPSSGRGLSLSRFVRFGY